MKQPKEFGGRTTGAAADDIVDCHKLAIEAWGDRCDEGNSALTAMAYLWRRFGPPIWGSDDHKDLCAYYLTTEDPRVFLWLHLGGSGLAISAGYVALEEIKEEIHRPEREWWKAYEEFWWKQHPEFEELEDTEENQEKVSTLFWDEQEREEMMGKAKNEIGECPGWWRRPENWRENEDGSLVKHVNQVLFDAMKELERPVYIRDVPINIFGRCNDDYEHAAKPSKYAGLGVPVEEMNKMLKEDEDAIEEFVEQEGLGEEDMERDL